MPDTKPDVRLCPVCVQKGRRVQLITLKALLVPSALETIGRTRSHVVFSSANCEVVYFSDAQTYDKDTIKVPVVQKDGGTAVPVWYCFGWTRERVMKTLVSRFRRIVVAVKSTIRRLVVVCGT